jgi:acetyl esterase/lipase
MRPYRFLVILLSVLRCGSGEPPAVAAQSTAVATAPPAPWKPSPGHTEIPLWPNQPPPGVGPDVTSTIEPGTGYGRKLVGGRPWTYIAGVTEPTITVYSPQRRTSDAAVVVFPGGGYEVVAVDLEGTEICDWLTSRGITCVLLKYRVPCTHIGPYRDCPPAHEDAQRAVGLVRSRAAEWHINPNKIGVIGFSAGGHMVAAISTHFEGRRYPPVDEADKVSCRPNFAIALYPGHLAIAEDNFILNPDIQVTSRTPPTLLVHAYDDPVDPVENSLVYYAALRKAGVAAEMHVYAKGGHAFGLRPTSSPITQWPKLTEEWLKTIGMIE